MTPFRKLPQTPIFGMLHREILLSQPAEYYKEYFGGRTPSLSEKQHVVELMVQNLTSFDIYQNDTYIVEVMHTPPYIHLSIQRNDGEPRESWRDFQQIKNEIVGVEHEAMEIFPAESRLVDTANKYHLWVHADPHHRIPVGFERRRVTSKPLGLPAVDGAVTNHARMIADLAQVTAAMGIC
jgi:hypothetical protein